MNLKKRYLTPNINTSSRILGLNFPLRVLVISASNFVNWTVLIHIQTLHCSAISYLQLLTVQSTLAADTFSWTATLKETSQLLTQSGAQNLSKLCVHRKRNKCVVTWLWRLPFTAAAWLAGTEWRWCSDDTFQHEKGYQTLVGAMRYW